MLVTILDPTRQRCAEGVLCPNGTVANFYALSRRVRKSGPEELREHGRRGMWVQVINNLNPLFKRFLW